MIISHLSEAIKIGNRILAIEKNSEIPWRDKYEIIFSLYKSLVSFEYYIEWFNPDIDYEVDARSFCRALEKNLKTWKIVQGITGDDVGYNVPFQ
jgi:hypothetical protein